MPRYGIICIPSWAIDFIDIGLIVIENLMRFAYKLIIGELVFNWLYFIHSEQRNMVRGSHTLRQILHTFSEEQIYIILLLSLCSTISYQMSKTSNTTEIHTEDKCLHSQ